VIATAAGLLLAFFYLRTRDLKANIMAHFLVDFIPNVLAPLLS
jgi:membrane protease YdiL (CAAX protease family)